MVKTKCKSGNNGDVHLSNQNLNGKFGFGKEKPKVMRHTFGFTLIEMLVVMVVIGILATISLIAVQGVRESARNSRRKSDLETVRKVLEFYRADCNHYPTGLSFGGRLVGDNSTSACPRTNVYAQELPQDTLAPGRRYYYRRISNFDYVLCAALEDEGDTSAASSAGCGSCGSARCNYFVKP